MGKSRVCHTPRCPKEPNQAYESVQRNPHNAHFADNAQRSGPPRPPFAPRRAYPRIISLIATQCRPVNESFRVRPTNRRLEIPAIRGSVSDPLKSDTRAPGEFRMVTGTARSVHLPGPLSCGMKDTQDFHDTAAHSIGQDIREPRHDQFASTRYSARSPHVGVIREHCGAVAQMHHKLRRRTGAVPGNVGRFVVKVLQGATQPFNLHTSSRWHRLHYPMRSHWHPLP